MIEYEDVLLNSLDELEKSVPLLQGVMPVAVAVALVDAALSSVAEARVVDVPEL